MINKKELVRSYITQSGIPLLCDEVLKNASPTGVIGEGLARMPLIERECLRHLKNLPIEWLDKYAKLGYVSYFIDLKKSNTSVEDILSNSVMYINTETDSINLHSLCCQDVDEDAEVKTVSCLFGEYISTVPVSSRIDLLISVLKEFLRTPICNNIEYKYYSVFHPELSDIIKQADELYTYYKNHPDDVTAKSQLETLLTRSFQDVQCNFYSLLSPESTDQSITVIKDGYEILYYPTILITVKNENGYLDGCFIIFETDVIGKEIAPLRFTNIGEETAAIRFEDELSTGTVLKYRFINNPTYYDWDYNSESIFLNSGEYVEIVGNNIDKDRYLGHFSIEEGQIAGSGSIMTMIYGENMTRKQERYIPYCAFVDDTYSCDYGSTFNKCITLVSSPELPAIYLSPDCYVELFSGCTSLVIPPKLPAIEMVEGEEGCYSSMFNNCTSLTTAPELPANELAFNCYSYMFSGCTSLTTAPELPATELKEGCYQGMFYKCTSLTEASELPATKLATSCYNSMFRGCTSLTTAPELPAITIVNSCYSQMFEDCTSLSYVTCLATGITHYGNYTTNWLKNVSLSGTFIKNPLSEWLYGDDKGIPEGWDVEDAYKITNYVTITALEDDVDVKFNQISTNQVIGLSLDGIEWFVSTKGYYSYPGSTLNENETMYIAGVLSGDNTSDNYTNIRVQGYSKASGNVNSIWNCFNLNEPLKQYCGYMLFKNCSFTDISQLILPSKVLATGCYESMFGACYNITAPPTLPVATLASNCYQGMFTGCTGLKTAPELPAMTLTERCYRQMFSNCTSLTAAPELPATKLADWCYEGMFQDCTSLTAAPELPAMTLTERCYRQMFSNCTSLTAAPELPATKLADYCYNDMFDECTSLTTVPKLPATNLNKQCYTSMFYGCTALTAAPKLPATILKDNCYSSMFYGCTSLTAAPKLPATTLASSCYGGMFRGCTSLTTAPELPAKDLVAGCYNSMFQNCSSLNYIKCLAETNIVTTGTINQRTVYNWVNGVSATGTFVKSANADSWIEGVSGIPSDWEVQIA